MGWATDLENTIRNINYKTKKQTDNNGVVVIGLLFMIGACCFALVNSKNVNVWPKSQTPVYNQQSSWMNQPSAAPVDLKTQVDKLTDATKKIWERSKWNSDRLTLLATINNHNLVVTQQGLPRSELILLNSDWTIDKMPNRIQLDPQDQAFIKQFLRK